MATALPRKRKLYPLVAPYRSRDIDAAYMMRLADIQAGRNLSVPYTDTASSRMAQQNIRYFGRAAYVSFAVAIGALIAAVIAQLVGA